jgi:quinohemoprotein ethanol dehydrogenase
MILADIPIAGKMRKVIMQAPKNGFFYVLDRATGKLISAEKFTSINWASHVDMKTGRPVENPAVRYGEVPVMVSPGAGGGHNWNPMAFSPKTGLVYIPVSETYMAYAAAASYDMDKHQGLGTSFSGYEAERKAIADYADAHTKGWLSAWNPATHKEVWRVAHPLNGSGGTLATAGNLVFQGTIESSLAAYAADTGRKLWDMPLQNVAVAAPITYMVDGEQYVAVNAGWGGGLAHVERAKYTSLFLGKPRLLVFKLGGTARLPPLPPESRIVPELQPPPKFTGTSEQVAKGEQLYGDNCRLCHGVAARGGVKDLRHMSEATHKEFLDIVLGGKRARNGMASFADTLSREDAEAIHHYLVKRANEDWEDEAGQ